VNFNIAKTVEPERQRSSYHDDCGVDEEQEEGALSSAGICESKSEWVRDASKLKLAVLDALEERERDLSEQERGRSS